MTMVTIYMPDYGESATRDWIFSSLLAKGVVIII